MEATGLSASGVLNELVLRMQVDDNGQPVWADELTRSGQLALDEPTAEPAWLAA
jgi:hypothetical protein